MARTERDATSRSVWTQFMDMHSGGGQKLKWAYIYIEAPEKEAAIIFQNRFKRNPHRVTCTCCGDDYSLSEDATLREATAYNRGCEFAYFDKDGNEVEQDEAWVRGKGMVKGYTQGYVERPRHRMFGTGQVIPLEEYVQQKDVHVIYAKDIKPKERKGELQEEGYVWKD